MKYRELMDAAAAYLVEEKVEVSAPGVAADFFRPMAQGLEQEHFWVASLDPQNHILSVETIAIGLADRCPIHAREIFRAAIIANAVGVLLAHNHPSGDTTPSAEDITATGEVYKAGKILGIEVLDHIILGTRTHRDAKDYYSMRENGRI